MWDESREKIELELAQLRRLVDSHRPLLEKVADSAPDSIELSALSAYLHSFYTGLENIFKQIAVGIDQWRPTAGQWHSDLLRAMAAPTPRRPAVISAALMPRLVGYMGFRHVFRHAYTFELKWRKMANLVLESEETLREIAAVCQALFETSQPQDCNDSM